METMEEEVSSFSLQSGTDSFVSRSRDVFASLGALEDKHSAFLKATASSRDKDEAGIIKDDPDGDDEMINLAQSKSRGTEDQDSWAHGRSRLSKTRDTDYESRSHSRSPYRDKHSSSTGDDSETDVDGNFKRPIGHQQRFSRKSIPDFKKHPEKYTWYSLRDVPEQHMSEKANQKAALSFLEEQKTEREKQERKLVGLPEEEQKFNVADAACSQGKITFSQQKQKTKQSHTAEKSASKEVDLSLFEQNTDPTKNESDEESRDPETNSQDDNELRKESRETSTSSNTFKSRKNVRRHIRTKGSDSD